MKNTKAFQRFATISASVVLVFTGWQAAATDAGHGGLIRDNKEANAPAKPTAKPCGSEGSIADRIKSCGETRTLSNGSTVTVVSVEVVANGVVKKYERDDTTNNIWSPHSEKDMTWEDALDYCKGLNNQNPPPLGITSWHLPVEDMVVGDKDKSEFLTAFNNPENGQRENKSGVYPINKLLLEAFPDMKNRLFWSSSPDKGVAPYFYGYDGEGYNGYRYYLRTARCVGR